MKNKYLIISLLLCLSLLINGAFSSTDNTAVENFPVWKFAVISDTQGNSKEQNSKSCINDEILNSIAADIAAEKPDFVLVSGDLVNGWLKNEGTPYASQYRNWEESMKPVTSRGIKIFAVRGNHDSGPERLALPPLPEHLEPQPGSLSLLEKEFKEAIIESYIPRNGPEKEKGLTYSFVHKNAHIIGLDQYTDGQHRINQKWLDRKLSGKRRLHLFVFGHEPVFETVHKDNLSFYRGKRNRFWDSIGRAGGRIYFCGHDHFYNRALVQDSRGNHIWQIISGTGGGKLQKWPGSYKEKNRVSCEFHNGDYHGYILVTVDDHEVKVEWKALVDTSKHKWLVLDMFKYSYGEK